MVVQNSNDTPADQFHPSELDPSENTPSALEDDTFQRTRIRVRIPKHYHQEPVISRLVSHHGVTVNITAALLGVNARDDGWFDLELTGTAEQIRSALIYINDLDLEVWSESNSQEYSW